MALMAGIMAAQQPRPKPLPRLLLGGPSLQLGAAEVQLRVLGGALSLIAHTY
jgi:hypothetical protein